MIKVTLSYSWTFSLTEWAKFMEHYERISKNPKIALGVDPVSTFYHLRDIGNPDLEEFKVENMS